MAHFYLDHNVARDLAAELATLGHQARTARDLQLERASDAQHLRIAAERKWLLITHNKKDFELLQDAWRLWQQGWGISHFHAGILCCEQVPVLELARVIDEFTRAYDPPTNELYGWTRTKGWGYYEPKG